MSQVTVASTSNGSLTNVYAGLRKFVRVKNLEQTVANSGTGITIRVFDPSCNTPSTFVDLPPQEDHIFKRGNVPGAMGAYGSSANGTLLVNEIGD